MEAAGESSHPNYRLFMSAEPAELAGLWQNVIN